MRACRSPEADATPSEVGSDVQGRVRFQNSRSTNVCIAMPSVAVPPRSAIIPASQSATAVKGPLKTRRNTPNPAIETRLFTVGAQL